MANVLINLFNDNQFRQYLAVLIATFAFLSCGMSTGWPSAVLPMLLSDHPPVKLTSEEISWVISIMNLSNMLSPYPCGFLMDRYGRKHTLLLLSILPTASWALITIGETILVLSIARILNGFWQGIVYTILPIYIAEIAEPKFRSQMGTLMSFMMSLGILITYIIAPILSYTLIAIVNGLIPIIFFCCFIWMPESPTYYLIHKDYLKAEKALNWFRGSVDKNKIIMELDVMQKSVARDMENKGTVRDIFKTRGTIKGFIIAIGLAVFQRVSGITSIVVFSSTTLPEGGFLCISRDQFVIVIGVILVVFTLIASVFIKRFGNVPLLVTTSILCGIFMFIAAVWFHYEPTTLPSFQEYKWVPYLCFAIHTVFYSLGVGSIGNAIRGEMFPTNIRAISSALTTNIASLTTFLQTKTYFPIEQRYGMQVNYYINSICCFACACFSFLFVIETKGKSLIEIQEELGRKK
uniref:Major facilitator superfamily (MFS) profile domain-containing protein n=1 Tax=Clastoptera arizonana TaxID=38151 RepID=A0A1B6E018_9HEMI